MSCTEVKSEKYQKRKSPPFHAGDCKGQTKKGKNGTYISKADKRGTYKWMKTTGNTSRNMTRKKGTTTYLTHDNGSTPFRVLVHGNHVEIEHTDTNKRIKSYTVKKIHYGVSKGDQKTKGNSVLLELGNKYVFIGHEIYEFTMEDKVQHYFSLIGNNDVPYPVLLGTEYVYFMLDHTYVPCSEFEVKMSPKMWEDAYAYYYGWLDAKTGKKSDGTASLEGKAKKMKGFRMVQRKK